MPSRDGVWRDEILQRCGADLLEPGHSGLRTGAVTAVMRQAPWAVRFGPFRLELPTGELFCGEDKLPLRPQCFLVLRALLERPGEVVTRDELVALLWPEDEVFVEYDLSLNAAVRRLREVLGDDAKNPRYVETLPRRGYRFVAAAEIETRTAGVGPEVRSPPPAPSATGSRRVPAAWAVGLVVVLVAVGVAVHRFAAPDPPPAPAELVVAVEPFASIGEAVEKKYLATALAQEILVEVGSIVLPEGRLLTQWRGSEGAEALDPAGPDQPATFRIGGTYTWAEDRVRVVAVLRRVATGEVLWAESFESLEDGLLELQQSLAQSIASAVAATLLGSDGVGTASAARPVAPAGAYDEYLKGLYLREEETVPSIEAALAHFERATRLGPGFAEAFAAAATQHLRLAFRGAGDEHWDGARAAADRALALDPSVAEAHVGRGFLALYRDWDFAAAGAELRRALELAPGWGEAHSAYAAYLTVLGRFDEAVPRARLARRLDPVKMSVRGDLCWYLNHAGRFVEAEAECGRALELEPGDGNSRLGLAEALRQRGDNTGSFQHAAQALGLPDPLPRPADDLEARRWLDRLWHSAFAAASAQGQGAQAYFAATAGALAGMDDDALTLLEEAFASKEPAILHFRSDPRLAILARDERFVGIARRIGFPPS